MYRFFLLLFISFDLSAKNCSEVYDLDTGLYDVECASLYVNLAQNDYSFLMGFSGLMFGAVFMASIVFAVLHVGKSWRI